MGSLWQPWGAVRVDGVPELGAWLAADHVVWHVVAVTEWPAHSEYPGAYTHELTAEALTGAPASRRVLAGPYGAWWTYRGRYPVCSCCGEPAPCRRTITDEAVEQLVTRMRRFEVAGVCPACGLPVSSGQPSVTFPDNVEVPLGPPVTFHLAPARCRREAAAYPRMSLADYPQVQRGTDV